MSVFLKPGVLKVRGSDDEFSEVNIMAEGSTQSYIDAIQNKGTEVLDSIPQNYEELVDEVEDLNSAIDTADIYYYAKRGVWNGSTVIASNNVAHVIDVPLNRYRKFQFHYPSTLRYYSLWKKVNGTWSSVAGITDDTFEADETVENFIVQFVNKTSTSTAITDDELAQIYLLCVDKDIENIETRLDTAENDIDILESKVDTIPDVVEPKNTSFFDGVNYFDPDSAVVYTDRAFNGTRIVSVNDVFSVAFPVKPNTTYFLYVPDANRAFFGESTDDNFPTDKTLTALQTSSTTYPVSFTTGATAKYVFAYCNSGIYDYASKKSQIVLNVGKYYGLITPYIPKKYIDPNVVNVLDGANILIFGDSITDSCRFTINSANETTMVVWREPTGSYVNEHGETINLSFWPKILMESQPVGEVRNYALSGASFKTQERASGSERQNVQYQITVAINDRYNPNNVFAVDDFVPDIVIFALGTNDGVPADTFESAMNATVYQSDNVSIDVDATIAALDDTKTISSARKAFLRIKQAFPTSQIFVSLPIQRANNDVNLGVLHEYLSDMASRYGCVVIDSTTTSGITRDFNNWDTFGVYLKDGLHPNELGQNMLARTIISALLRNYIPYGTGYNTIT